MVSQDDKSRQRVAPSARKGEFFTTVRFAEKEENEMQIKIARLKQASVDRGRTDSADKLATQRGLVLFEDTL